MVLYYHSIPEEFRVRFALQLDAIQRCTSPIHPENVTLFDNGKQYSLVTFDDGFTNFLENALPELVSRKIPSLMFIITEALGKSFGPPSAPEKIMTVTQLRNLPDSLVVVGSHTLTHPYLPDVSEQDARRELSESRFHLEALLDRPVRFFSFPFGGMNSNLASFCKEAGYSRIFSTLPAFTSLDQSQYCVGRVRVDPWDWPAEFRLKLVGAYNWLPLAISLKKMLVANSVISYLLRRQKSAHTGTIRRAFIHE